MSSPHPRGSRLTVWPETAAGERHVQKFLWYQGKLCEAFKAWCRTDITTGLLWCSSVNLCFCRFAALSGDDYAKTLAVVMGTGLLSFFFLNQEYPIY